MEETDMAGAVNEKERAVTTGRDEKDGSDSEYDVVRSIGRSEMSAKAQSGEESCFAIYASSDI